ncbi:MAG: hypothetical protein HUU50_08880 [Candidatus Brocadiae bacterium]|nr:hypothetical protein [Candidatus Brocadiia bacterium]
MSDTPIGNFNAVHEGNMDWADTINGYWQNLEEAFVSGGKYISSLNVDNGVLFVDTTADRIGIKTSTPNAVLDVRGNAIFNEEAADNDFRIEGTGEENLFFLDAGNNRIGIGTNSPTARIDVRGDAIFNGGSSNSNFRVKGSSNENLFCVNAEFNRVGIGTSSPVTFFEVSNSAANPMPPSIGKFVGNRDDGRAASIEIRNTNESSLAFSGIEIYVGTNDTGAAMYVSPAAHTSYGIVNGLNIQNTSQDIGFRLESTTALILKNSNKYIGIGTISPSAKLDVDGDAVFNKSKADKDFIIWGTDSTNSNLYIDASTNSVGIGTNAPNSKLDVRGSAIFNEDGADNDIRIEGDSDANLFFTDAGNDRVGIGTNAPNAKLDVSGTSRFGDSSTNYVSIGSTGNLAFQGSAEFHPRRISQDSQPTLSAGEMAIWHDADDSKVYILYNDSTMGHVKIEMV